MAMIKIRPACADEATALLPLVEQYWAFERLAGFRAEPVQAQLVRLLSDSRLGCGLVAVDDGVAVAYILVVHVFSLEHFGLTAEIDELFVSPEYRGQGIGQRLMATAEAQARQLGCTNMSLQLALGNEAARQFYLHQGYSPRAEFGLLDKALAPE